MLTYDDLSGDQRELAECIGIDNYIEIIKYCGGCSVYFPCEEVICRVVRNRQIINEFNGANYRKLSKKYKLSERQIRNIINGCD